MSLTIRKGDQVIVRAGKNRGQSGRVLEVKRDARGRAVKVLVEHINMVYRHRRQAPQRPGGIMEKEALIDASNVMLIDPKSNAGTRIGAKTDEKGNKTRIARKSDLAV